MKTSSDSPIPLRSPSPNGSAGNHGNAASGGDRGQDAAVILDALRSLVRELRLASREAEQRVGVHGAQLHALRQLADNPATSLTELAERTHTDISSVSVVVSRLVEQGLVARKSADDDRRRLSLGLTARGRAVVRRAPEVGTSRLLRAASKLSDREMRSLASSLAKIATGLRKDD
ncbi:MAG TPA: MarR family transcriptional regulator [Gemmatimonadaceae bacterium]|jgi:DNA-binding MarR family transcriptional regulator|nr:MarR family transcriptional regulator [Gemmatimonadaceae bacterium]